jgi:hypothetical protein
MHSFLCKRSVVTLGLLAAALGALTPQAADAKPRPGKGAHGFRLFARSLGALTINRAYCGLSSTGEICVDSTNSSTIGGGFWPKGTADQYVFNSGLQLAGTVDAAAGFAWAGDTTGAFLFDPKGTTQHGEQVSPIYNMSNPEDLTAVSDSQASGEQLAARVPIGDASENLFVPLLRGRPSASQGDVWFLTWEGNPSQNAGRKHPLGVLVEQRGLGWNFPSGNEDIIYFIYTFYNVTAKASSGVYASIRPGMRDIAEARGDLFQSSNEAAFGVDIPDGGYTINNLFAAFSMDADVAEATANYSSVNVPFALGYVYEHTFSGASGWTFDPGIFGTPFFPGSGFVGVKYLKSPVDPVTGAQVGLTLFSNTINQGAFDDAQNTVQLFRYLSGNISVPAGDAACNNDPLTTKICYVNTGAPDDMRFFQSSGPLTLAPGQFQSIVVAYIFAAPVATSGCPAAGACDLTPGDPVRTETLAALTSSAGLNPVDSVAGYLGFGGDANTNGIPEQSEYNLPVSGSLMGKALTAQSVFDFNFLLPFAPDAPQFYVVPGDNQVSVLWQPSPTETTGDPFFAIASQVTITDTLGNPLPNPLYDPNYRQFDVEGYRIYRGRVDNPNELQLLGQFDYTGTFIQDFAEQVNPTTACAPELGINVFTPITDSTGAVTDSTPGCPVVFDTVVPGVARTVHNDVPLVGPIVQVKLTGGRDKLATGSAIFLQTDTAMTGAGGSGTVLEDTGVPFVFVDQTARNNLRYFYSVVAFDVNSFQSGPSSLESPRNTKPAVPQHSAGNLQSTGTLTQSVVGRGVASTATTLPTLDGATGRFSGKMPPADNVTLGYFGQFIQGLFSGTQEFSASLLGMSLGDARNGIPATYTWHVTGATGDTVTFTLPITQSTTITNTTAGSSPFNATTVDPALAARFGLTQSFVQSGQLTQGLVGYEATNGFGRGCFIDETIGTNCGLNGPRWFSGANETRADPNSGNDLAGGAAPSSLNNAGELPGVVTLQNPQGYVQVDGGYRAIEAFLGGATRAADINMYWGAGGVVDSVIDITHNVPVPFADSMGGTWGFLNTSAATGTASDGRPTILTLNDFGCVAPLNDANRQPDGALWLIADCTAGPIYPLSNTAIPGPIAIYGGALTSGATAPQNPNNGFGLYLAGHIFMMELAGGAVPAQGTVWTMRSYIGYINGGTPYGSPYAFTSQPRTFNAVGADLKLTVTASNEVVAATDQDLSRVHTVPDPYYVTNQFEQTTDTKVIKFVNLPNDCIVRIYSSSGVLVTMLEHHTTTFGGAEDWNVRNRNNQVVASGVYFYHIESGDARRVGRFTIVNFAE